MNDATQAIEIGGEPPSDELVLVDARAGAGLRIDRFLASVIDGVSRTRIQRWIVLGAVTVDGTAVLPKYRLRGIERIEVTPMPAEAELAFEADPVDLAIVHEDVDVLVLDKPAGLVTHPGPGNWRRTLMNGLLQAYPQAWALPRAGIVHRLDKGTSGLMVVARNEMAYESLCRQLAERSVSRRYLALVEGETDAHGVVDVPIGRDRTNRLRMAVVPETLGKRAVTHWRRLDLCKAPRQLTLIECRLETGRTHQIRIHLAHLGHPLVGDRLYGGAGLDNLSRPALHAWSLGFAHPRSGRALRFRAAPPSDLLELFDALGIAESVAALLRT